MINLNGFDIPSFVKVNNIEYSILPPIENNTIQVRGRKGLYNYGQNLGTRKFMVEITLVADALNGVMEKASELALWLYQEDVVPLVIADSPNKAWMVLVDGETNISELHTTGKATLQFICTEPFAYGEEHSIAVTPANDEPFFFDVLGTSETYPLIELKVKQNNVDTLTIFSDDGVVMLGEPNEVEKAITNTLPTRLNDNGTNISSWTSASAVDGGIIAGDYASNGNTFVVAGGDYGTNANGWHGPSRVRSLATPIQDFEVETWITLNSTNKNQMGRVEVYLLDANNVQFGKIALNDNYAGYDFPRFEARAGGLTNGNYFISELQKKGTWTNFWGILRIGRKGKKWYASIGKYDSTKKVFHSRMYKEWTDTKNLHSNKLAKVQIHTGATRSYVPYASASVSNVIVKEHVVLSTVQAPLIADANDVFLIDCEKSIVYKNGHPFYEGLNPVSKFFSLKKGYNGLSISPAVADVKITYKERWM